MQKKMEELESKLRSESSGQQINTDKVQNTANVESLAKAMKPWIKVAVNRAVGDRLGESQPIAHLPAYQLSPT